jgi:predicted transcriptional regulator
MMIKKTVLNALIDNKKAAILRCLLNSSEELCLKEISKASQVSLTTSFRILQNLVELEIISPREWKNSKTYTLPDNDKTKYLRELLHEDYDGVAEFVKIVRGLSGVSKIIQHGTQKKGANILILGENINPEILEATRDKIKKQGFNLSFLTLTPQQYDQMVQMGLYPGDKKVI